MRLIGSIFMIVGVSIGGATVALPVSTATGGFWKSSLLLLIIWAVMTTAAFLILEVNLSLPPQSNLISMAKQTLGPIGAGICWFAYLLLLYCLLCAYTAGGSDIFHSLLESAHIQTSRITDTVLFIVVFSTVVYLGIHAVDHVNRLLIVLKVTTFSALLLFLFPHVHTSNLVSGHYSLLLSSIVVVITSFGYAIIVPSLRVYLKSNVGQLRLAIIIGSLIPLVCYLIWNYIVQGSITKQTLTTIAKSNVASQLTHQLSLTSHYPWLIPVIHTFTSVCLLTSFLGVSLSLTDFLADGLSIEKSGWRKVMIHMLIFLPPLLIIIFYPHAFIPAFSYAGIACIIILILFPVLMAYFNRRNSQHPLIYRLFGGTPLLLAMLVISLLLLVVAIMEL